MTKIIALVIVKQNIQLYRECSCPLVKNSNKTGSWRCTKAASCAVSDHTLLWEIVCQHAIIPTLICRVPILLKILILMPSLFTHLTCFHSCSLKFMIGITQQEVFPYTVLLNSCLVVLNLQFVQWICLLLSILLSSNLAKPGVAWKYGEFITLSISKGLFPTLLLYSTIWT